MTATAPETPSLSSVLDDVWEALVAGCARSRSPIHTPTIATLRDGEPRLRTVVLQHVDRAHGTLGFHTDRRSPKTRDLTTHPGLEWHFYDREHKTQIRARGDATLHVDDDVADKAWSATPPLARRCYGQALGPGQHAEDPLVELPSLEGLEAAEAEVVGPCRENFCVVRSRVVEIDWLHLRFAGHLRAQFTLGDGAWAGRWLAP